PSRIMAIGVAVVCPERIAARTDANIDPTVVAEARVSGFEVIAVVVGAVAGADEERAVDRIVVHDVCGTINIGPRHDESAPAINRAEEQAARSQRVVPVAIDEDVADRRPDIVRGDVDPTWTERIPEARPPHVSCVMPDPHAGGVRVIIAWRLRLSFLNW